MSNHIFTPFMQIFETVLEISFQRLIKGRYVEFDFHNFKCTKRLFL